VPTVSSSPMTLQVMQISVITGSELADHTVEVLRYATEFDDDLRGQFESDENDLPQELGALLQGPTDWAIELPSSLSGHVGGTSEFDLGLVAQSIGRGYFALVLSDPKYPEDDEISPGFSLEVAIEADEMVLNVVTDSTGMEMPELAFA
jgi:hypothetical protein